MYLQLRMSCHPGYCKIMAAGCYEHVHVLGNVLFGVGHAHLQIGI